MSILSIRRVNTVVVVMYVDEPTVFLKTSLRLFFVLSAGICNVSHSIWYQLPP